MFHNFIKFIHKLRVLMLFVILVFSFIVIGANPIDVTKYLGAGFSSAFGVSNSASVTPNPINSLALQLDQKQKALDTREQQLNKQEQDIEANIIAKQNKLIWTLFGGIGVLFVLIMTNFIMDIKRRRK